jgi:uncharacterized protein (TIGR02646 family)
MIHVDRSRVSVPGILRSTHVIESKVKAERFYRLKTRSRTQRRLDLSIEPIQHELARSLAELFQNKCAYCERRLENASHRIVSHFRPRRSSIGQDGETYLDHYWWLAFEWDNLLLACADCHKMKGNRFPLLGPRAEILADRKSLAEEMPLLINPCSDRPERHLTFNLQAQITALSERGEATIKLLSLNRSRLVAERQTHLKYLLKESSRVLRSDPVTLKEWVFRMLGNQPFVALRRAWFKLHFIPLLTARPDYDALLGILRELGVTDPLRKERLPAVSQTASSDAGSSAPSQQQVRQAYFSQTRSIERIEIVNFKGIASFTFQAPEARSDSEFWLTFLGENATGKSSVLQAVALTLLGQTVANRMGVDAGQCVHRGASAGSVRITLTNVPQPVELQFQTGRRSFHVTPRLPIVLLMGFGPTRILPRARHHQRPASRGLRVKNLFDPFARLNHAERWLVDRSAVSDDRFNRVAIALKKLLMLGEEQQFSRDDGQVWVKLHGKKVGLSELSDGYQSILVMAVNIVMGVIDRWKEIELAEGVVLVDELEVHLHPRWKMEIVNRLRQVFPKMTFITTTHDPLCLRGLFPGEIIVLKRGEDGVVSPNVIQESVAHLRADQLLTSPLFGLVSTRDPEVTSQIDRYSELLGKTERNSDEETEFRSLGARLGSQLASTETPVSQMVEKTFERTLNEIVLPELKQKIAEFENSSMATAEARTAVANLLGLVKS